MSTEIAKADAGLQREVSKTSAEKASTGEHANQLPVLQEASTPALDPAIRPRIDYSSPGAFLKSFGK